MTEKIYIPDNIQEILTQIENVSDWWAEIPLGDHPKLTGFNRKLVVSGFNFPDLSEENNKRAEIFIRQIFSDKESGEAFVNRRQKPGSILIDTKTEFRKFGESNSMKFDRVIDSEIEGEAPVRDKVSINVNQIDYFKRNLLFNSESLVFMLEDYLKNYAINNASELDKI